MSLLGYIIVFSLLGGVVSLLGGVALLSKQSLAHKIAIYTAPFAAGALLGAAFLDILPEAVEEAEAANVLAWTLAGLLLFFLLERLLHWFHHHHEHKLAKTHPTATLVIVGDTLHNFIDGVVIAGAFLISIPTGIVATLAVAAHEIPQEIGDFGLLLKYGFSRAKVLLVNFLSALATLVAALLTYAIGSAESVPVAPLLGVAAGFFIYIACSDIIPEIHKTRQAKRVYIESGLLLLGVVTVGLVGQLAHHLVEG